MSNQLIESADDLASLAEHALLTMLRLGHSFPDLQEALDVYKEMRKPTSQYQ